MIKEFDQRIACCYPSVNSSLPVFDYRKLLSNTGMNIKEIRRENLIRALAAYDSIEQFADATDSNPKHISQLKNGTRNIGDRFSAKMEDALGLPRGAWDTLPGDNAGRELAAPYGVSDIDTISIPRLNVTGSMGKGVLMPVDHVDVIERMFVNVEYLRRTVAFSKASNLAIITGYGDSMKGTFEDGDLLLVDRGITQIKLDAVYVLGLNDELYIKRIQRRPDGSFLMLSDNPNYPPYEIKQADKDQFQVLARVLLVWNARKL